MFLDTYRRSMEHNNQNQLPRHHRHSWNTVPINVHEEKLYFTNMLDMDIRACLRITHFFSTHKQICFEVPIGQILC